MSEDSKKEDYYLIRQNKIIDEQIGVIYSAMRVADKIAAGLGLLGIESGKKLGWALDDMTEALDKIKDAQRAITHGNFKDAQQNSANLLGTVLAMSAMSNEDSLPNEEVKRVKGNETT